jgi:hypothetical protein
MNRKIFKENEKKSKIILKKLLNNKNKCSIIGAAQRKEVDR